MSPAGFGVQYITAIRVVPGSRPYTSSFDPAKRIRGMQQFELRSGWPLPALAARITAEVPNDAPKKSFSSSLQFQRTWRCGIKLRGMPSPWNGGQLDELGRALPVVPLWGGLLADMLVFAAVIMPGPILLEFRRTRRFKLRRCVACGHQLALDQETCPECGALRGAG